MDDLKLKVGLLVWLGNWKEGNSYWRVAEEAMLAGEVNYGALLGKDHDIGYGTREASLTLLYISFLSVNIFNFKVGN